MKTCGEARLAQAVREGAAMTELQTSCPECGSYAVTPTTRISDGRCEYRCDDCGHYFVDKAIAESISITKPGRKRFKRKAKR